MCDKSVTPERERDIAAYLSSQPLRAVSRRLALWEISGGMQCSIIGTCLCDEDVLAVLRKQKLRIARDAKHYDIHSYCVHEASRVSPVSRTLTKLLDRKYTGPLRMIGQAETEEDIRTAWERLRDTGQVAGGYWAVMSHAHVSQTLKSSIFGEVHMLSHLNGRNATLLTVRLAEAERRIGDLEQRLRRTEQAKQDTIKERDAARSALAKGTALEGAARIAASPAHAEAAGAAARKLAKCTRALMTARARARQAEAALARLAKPPVLQRELVKDRAEAAAGLPGAASAEGPRRILYLGGRTALVPHLRAVAQGRQTNFLHHDGGVEDSLHRIAEMIERCDAVVCPIDCVSHGACQMAKSLCQRLNKRFLPISTSSRSGFKRALELLGNGLQAAEPGATMKRPTPDTSLSADY